MLPSRNGRDLKERACRSLDEAFSMHGALLRTHHLTAGCADTAGQPERTTMNTHESRNEAAGTAGQYAELWQRAWEPYLRMFQQMAPAIHAGLQDLGQLPHRYAQVASSE